MKSYIHNSESSQKRLDQNIRKKHLNLFHLTLLEGLFTNFHIGGSRNRRVSAQRNCGCSERFYSVTDRSDRAVGVTGDSFWTDP